MLINLEKTLTVIKNVFNHMVFLKVLFSFNITDWRYYWIYGKDEAYIKM